jgi:hypothetical protein
MPARRERDTIPPSWRDVDDAMSSARHTLATLTRQPLLRLLAINLASGIAVAALAVGGLILLNPQLRRLIVEDQSPAVALVMLLFGFIITFGSCVMGAAIMRIGAER